MHRKYFIIVYLAVLSLIYVYLEITKKAVAAEYLRALVVPSICLYYLRQRKFKNKYLAWFFILYSISDLMVFFKTKLSFSQNYFFGNILYITAYCILVYSILKTLELSEVFSKFKWHILVLSVLNIYVMYSLVVLDLSIDVFNLDFTFVKSPLFEENWPSIILEFVYNSVILFVLSISFLNYLQHDSLKTFFLFVGCVGIVFSELMQFMLYFPSEGPIINICCYLLLIVGFVFCYLYGVQHAKAKLKPFKFS